MTEATVLIYLGVLCALEARFAKGFWSYPQWQTDCLHLLLSPRIVSLVQVKVLAPLAAIILTPLPKGEGSMQALDLLWLIPLADFCGYIMHRLQHEIPWLWRFHQVHHSSSPLNTLASSRFHPIDSILQQSAWYTPLFLAAWRDQQMSVEEGQLLLMSSAIYLAQIVLTHFHIPFGNRWEWLVSTPSFHHRHHELQARGNYGLQLTIWDSLFKTTLPKEPVKAYGIDTPLATDWIRHMVPPVPIEAERNSE